VKKTAKKPATPEDVALIAEKKRLAKEKLSAAKKKQRKQAAAAKLKAEEAALTPEDIEKRKAKLQKAEIRDLKKAALDVPFPTTLNAWSVFLRERGQELKASFDSSTKATPEEVRSHMAVHAGKVAAAYKELSASEMEVRIRRPQSLRLSRENRH